jgi:hypothetical protein
MKIFTILALSIFYIGCASKTKLECASTDWFELGRRHGLAGGEIKKDYGSAKACLKDPSLEKEYALQAESGYLAGLSEYCTTDNAVILGRAGIPFNNVCPDSQIEQLSTYYGRGVRIRDISENRRQVDARLTQVRNQLIDPSTSFPRRAVLEGEKIELSEKTTDLDDDLKSAKATTEETPATKARE